MIGDGQLKMSGTQVCSKCGHKTPFMEAFNKIVDAQRQVSGEPILYYECPQCLTRVKIQAEPINN